MVISTRPGVVGRRGSSVRDRRRPVAGRPAPAPTWSRPTVAATSGRGIDRAVGEAAMVASSPVRRDEDPDRGDVLECQDPGVERWACRRGRCRPRGRAGSTSSSAMAGRCGALEASMTASKGRSGRSSAVHASAKPSAAAKPSELLGATEQVDLGSGGPGEHRDQQADGAGTEDQHAVAGLQGGRRAQRRALPPGSTRAPSSGVDGVGEPVERGDRNGELLGQGARDVRRGCRPPAGSRTRAGAPAGTARQRPSAQHGVARHPAADPRRVGAVPDCGHRAAPLVAEAHRDTGRGPGAGRPSRR